MSKVFSRGRGQLALGVMLAALGPTLASGQAQARNLLKADGPGGTYELIRTAYTTELPDCGHMVPHITEDMDAELGRPVFIFHAHVNQDDDRCGETDRQRTEIRGRAGDIVANNGETVYYRWKFKLATGFQGSPSFTHIFQIKSDQAAPVMTLTPRVSTMAIDGRIGARGTTSLSKFIGVWVVVDLKIQFGNAGRVEMKIRKLPGGEMLFDYAGEADTWDDNASAHDPKWGIYRSLNNRGMLRDEQVRFADFCVSKQNASECDDGALPPPTPTPMADAGAPPMADAGSPAPDTGAPAPTPDAEVVGKADGAVSTPPAMPRPDAGSSAPPARMDARPATMEPPPDDDPAPTSMARGGSSGCTAGGTMGPGSALAALILLGAALLRRRRPREP